jgi:hypothetical protein
MHSHGTEMPQNFLHKPEIIWSLSLVYLTALHFSYEIPTAPPPKPVSSAPIQPIGSMGRNAHSLTAVVKLIRKEKRVGLEGGIASANGVSL